MTLESDLFDLTDSGLELHYLRSNAGRWEALVRRPIPSPPTTIRYAVGFGVSHHPSIALDLALTALDHDPTFESIPLIEPTCAEVDRSAIDTILANLRRPSKLNIRRL